MTPLLEIDSVIAFLMAAVMAVGGATVLIASILVLVTSRKREVSIRTISAVLIGIWATMLIAQTVGGWSSSFRWSDQIGVLGLAMWCFHAMWKFRGRSITRATNWGALDGKEEITKHAELGSH